MINKTESQLSFINWGEAAGYSSYKLQAMKILIIISGIILIINISFVNAGWRDRSPSDINSIAYPGMVDPHSNSGGRRIVRINNTSIAITPHGTGERTYRSVNNGLSWDEIDRDGVFSGCLLTGKNQMVYHFYRSGDSIYMVKFKYNGTPPDPEVIYTDPDLSEASHGVYNMLNATVNNAGNIYVSAHWTSAGDGGDSLFLIESVDEGNTWTQNGDALIINRGSVDHSWGFIHLEVTSGNILVAVYSEWDSKSIQYSKSDDHGRTWITREIAGGEIYNPSILTQGGNKLYVFAQSIESASLRGLVFKYSDDLGDTWAEWKVIDSTSLSGYADPSPAIGSDGRIYVAYRSGARSDLQSVYGGNGCRERLAMSDDGGQTWSFPDDYFYDISGNPTPRTGCRSQIRYQTWWNYGGPLEWIWIQYNEDGTNRPIFYDINTDVNILSTEEGLELLITNPNNLTVNEPEFSITGIARAASGKTISNITSSNATIRADDGAFDEQEENWTSDVILSNGDNTYVFTARDSANETDQATITVNYSPITESPEIIITSQNNITVNDAAFTITGIARAATGKTISQVICLDSFVTAEDGTFDDQEEPWTSHVTLDEGENNFVFTVIDSENYASQVDFTVIYNNNLKNIKESGKGCFISIVTH